MICFPLDITEYEAVALGAWCATRTRGVSAVDGHYTVTATGGMGVTLGPGLAWLKMDTYWGVNAYSPEAVPLTFETADGALTRYAAICLRLDKNLNEGYPVVKYGPLSTNPQIGSLPPPEQGSLDYDEIYVAAVKIRAGATEILASDIYDLRLNEAYCGIMRDGVTGIPTQALYDQWWDWFSSLTMSVEQQATEFVGWMASFMATNEASISEWIANFKETHQNDIEQWYSYFTQTWATNVANWFSPFVSESENAFNTWFADLQNTLDDNQAANLFHKIDQHEQKNVSDPVGVHGLRVVSNQLQIFIDGVWISLMAIPQGFTAASFDARFYTALTFDASNFTAEIFDSTRG